MKLFIVLLALVYAISGDYSAETCQYTTSDGSIIDLSNLGYTNYTSFNGDRWYFKSCPYFNYGQSFCPEGVSVCKYDNKNVANQMDIIHEMGMTNSSQFSELSANGTNKGMEIMYTSSDNACPEGGNYKIIVEYVCAEYFYTTISSEDNCAYTVTIRTSEACEIPNVPIELMPTTMVQIHIHSLPLLFIVFSLISFCCFMCCCCAIRRRRCNNARKIQRQQFSSSAFQPIPTTQQSRVTGSTQSFNPLLAQPQYFYYYPTQQEMNAVQLDTISSDEQVAKELQAQFDQESQ